MDRPDRAVPCDLSIVIPLYFFRGLKRAEHLWFPSSDHSYLQKALYEDWLDLEEQRDHNPLPNRLDGNPMARIPNGDSP
jgi:hypothetical protein